MLRQLLEKFELYVTVLSLPSLAGGLLGFSGFHLGPEGCATAGGGGSSLSLWPEFVRWQDGGRSCHRRGWVIAQLGDYLSLWRVGLLLRLN